MVSSLRSFDPRVIMAGMPMSGSLEKAQPFGNVALKPKRFSHAHLPPKLLLETLNTLFTDPDFSIADDRDRFTVIAYKPGEFYRGGTVYAPRLLFHESEHAEHLLIASVYACRSRWDFGEARARPINPQHNRQSTYLLIGSTWTPGNEVAMRTLEHEKLADFGRVLLAQIPEIADSYEAIKRPGRS